MPTHVDGYRLRVAVVLVAGCTVACSGGSSKVESPVAPTPTPVQPAPPPTSVPVANLILADESTITRGNCEAQIAEALTAGAATTTCPFSGLLRNMGQGCAANVRGTSSVSRDREGQQQLGSADWTYAGVVQPAEEVTYSGESITVPTSGQWFWRSSVNWNNVRC